MVGTLGFVVKKGSNKYGLTGSGFDVNGVPLEPAFIRNGDNTGYVGLYLDSGYYYLRPYAANKVCCGGNENRWYKVFTNELDASGALTVGSKATFNGQLWCADVYSKQMTGGRTVYVGEQGRMRTLSSSSQKYKHDIQKISDTSLDPHNLYNIDVVQFKYNDDVIDREDQRYMKDIPGFIAEDVYEKYPIAVDVCNGEVEDWNYRYLIPPMLKLIQEQHEEIEELKTNMESIKAENELLKSQLSSILERLEKLETQN